jgi:nitrite reductase/ring-hydroxylating ferredoxin subunit
MARSERDTVLNHRCPRCGGPISDGAMSPMLVCLWCGEEYAVKNGELVSKLEDHLLMRPKRQMREFYTIQPKR